MNHLFTKTFLSIIFISVLFTSCTDNDYDTDDLNKDAVWSPGGVSLPIGNLKSITLLDELNGLINDQSNPIRIADDGSLYLSYSGDLSFSIPEVEPLEDAEEPIAQVSMSNFGLVTDYPYSGQEIEVAPHTSSSINYEFADPVYTGDDWEIDVDSIGLDNCPLTAELELYGITFNDRGTPTYLEIVVTIPAAFTLPDNTSRIVTKNVNMSDFVNGKYDLRLVDIIGYKYRHEIEMSYGVKIHTGSNTSVTTTSNSFTFDMNFVSCDIDMTVIKGKIKIDQHIEGSNTKISSFGKTFANDIMIVDNPSLRIDVTTNFGFDFDLTMDQLTAKKDGEAPVIINNTVPMSFTKPANFPDAKTTSYLYAVKNDGSVNNHFFIPMNIGSLIDTKPNEISYSIVGNTEEENAYIVPHNMILDAKYDVIVPFGFKQMSLNIDKTLENIFDEDVVDRFFKEGSGDVIISADSVDVQIGDLAQKTQLEIILNVSFLDEQMNPTRAKTEPVVLGNIKDQKFSVKISDMAGMKDARHLKFSFVIQKPDNGTPVTFKVSDFLSIAKLKIKKEGGISINLDDI